ncbi:961_t:CDS:1, partial [Gigaspora rosea]
DSASDIKCMSFYNAGYVCANQNPGQNTCIYACHSGLDCESGLCDDKASPHWLCTCKSDTDCYATELGHKCVSGH